MTKTASEIVELFLHGNRNDIRLTVNQTKWLWSVGSAEARRLQMRVGQYVCGRLDDGYDWSLARYPNGAGLLKLTAPISKEEVQRVHTKLHYERTLAAINEHAMQMMLAGQNPRNFMVQAMEWVGPRFNELLKL